MRKNEITNYKDFYVSVAFNSTYSGERLIDETALVFEENGKRRFWILQHDVRDIYKDAKSLDEAKEIYRREHNKGNMAFWSDYSEKKDNSHD